MSIYEKTEAGGMRFLSRREGHVRIPNYVFDLWMPLIGAKAIGVYSTYCRLEREGIVKALSQSDIARACRIGERTLGGINETLRKYGFISIRKPKGQERLMHWTMEITVLDPPKEIPPEVIAECEPSTGAYSPLTSWLVAESPALSNDNADSVNEQRDALSNDNANVEYHGVEALEVKEQHGDITSPCEQIPLLEPPEPPRRKRSEKDEVREQLEIHFSSTTGLPRPKTETVKQKRAAGSLWWGPLREIAELCKWDGQRAMKLIDVTLAHMRKSGLTITSPKSIVATSRAVITGNAPGARMPSAASERKFELVIDEATGVPIAREISA